MSELMECPFCGWYTPALQEAGLDRYQVKCPACGGRGGICKGITATQDQWNMRPDHRLTDKEVDRICAILYTSQWARKPWENHISSDYREGMRKTVKTALEIRI